VEGVQVSPRILPALLLGGLMTGCGQGPHLEGSVAPLLDLRYDIARAASNANEVSITFIDQLEPLPSEEPPPEDSTPPENTVLKVAARLDDLQPTPGVEIDLAELLGEGEDAPQRGAISRSVLDEPVREFPRILRGGLTVDKAIEGFTPCAKVNGDFHVTFVNGTDVYSGRTIFGRFEATVPPETPENPCP
jgi:hypothetical protein